MRLVNAQIDNINRLVHQYAGDDCRVYLFGSRVDDVARGGDVDLLVETTRAVPRLQRARLAMAIETAIGLPVDLIVKPENKVPTTFEKIAMSQAIPLVKGGVT